jgi:glycine dehydrogenase subunit 2
MAWRSLLMKKNNPVIFEKSVQGRKAFHIGKSRADEISLKNIPAGFFRKSSAPLPEMSERDLVSHFINLSRKNMSVDTNFYPLGSCTMKYNPKINEDIAATPSFRSLHPYEGEEHAQGALKLLYDFENTLSRLFGFDAFTLHPAAGAHGELTALMVVKKYFVKKGEKKRHIILVPDSSHGTNPASAFMCGFDTIVTVRSDNSGEIDISDLREKCTDEAACLMMTNPNTLGLFETKIKEIADIVHGKGALLYCDGANMNALMGIARPGKMGFDLMQLNLHKTFSAPHGGGGPGSGPVGVREFLVPFLPNPRITEKKGRYLLDFSSKKSIGSVRVFYGNLAVIVKAFCYVKALGEKELKKTSQLAVLNARYMKEKLKQVFPIAYDRPCMHEFVLSVRPNGNGIHTLDVAKALIDYGYHPPTIYFPLIVKEAIMIEPTETESRETLDEFVDAMKDIAKDIEKDPHKIRSAPVTTPVGRLDEVGAARNPVVNWFRSRK